MAMAVDKFEDLIAWQKARLLSREIYQATRSGSLAQDYGLGRQMQRATVSISSNIAEGFERGSPKEFHRFLVIAKGSCGELRSQLYLALDVGHINQPQFERLMQIANEVSRVIGGLRVSVAKRRNLKSNG